MDGDVEELQDRFEGGFDPGRSVSAEPGELVPPAGLFVLARLEDRAVGCGGLQVTGPGEGEIKRMWVAPDARGSVLSQRMPAALAGHAATRGTPTQSPHTTSTLALRRAPYTTTRKPARTPCTTHT